MYKSMGNGISNDFPKQLKATFERIDKVNFDEFELRDSYEVKLKHFKDNSKMRKSMGDLKILKRLEEATPMFNRSKFLWLNVLENRKMKQ